MKTNISAMIDGELDVRELREVCASLRQDEDLRHACTTYILIGDTLRGEPCLSTEITGFVANHLADEPVILAPRSFKDRVRDRAAWQSPVLALAATVAGVAVVAWLALPQVGPAKSPLPQLAMAVAPTVTPVRVGTVEANDMQEYVIAHQIHGGSSFLNRETQHIRTVALSTESH